MNEITNWSIRIEEEQLELLKKTANEQKRSINQQILYFIEKGMNCRCY